MSEGLYTAGAGMAAQQNRMDLLSNDIANLSTTGYQSQRVGFEDLLYSAEQGVPVGAGARTFDLGPNQAQGEIEPTNNPLDLALSGPGYFQVKTAGGGIGLTRDGSFELDANGSLVTSTGETLDPPIQVPKGTQPSDISVSSEGVVSVGGKTIGQITVVNVPSAAGLEPDGNSLLVPTAASGPPAPVSGTQIQQGALESSNVNLAVTMSEMLDAQRSYELASDAIKNQDEMLDVANQITK